ncbi:hypothetical protein ACWEVV_33915, partial [Amycolatopsis japonica]
PLLAGSLIPILGLSTLYLIDVIALTLTLVAVTRNATHDPLAVFGTAARTPARTPRTTVNRGT